MKNIRIHLEDRPGTLAALAETLGHAGVSIEGGGMFVIDGKEVAGKQVAGKQVAGKGVANFLVHDTTAARLALEAAGIHVLAEDDVVLQTLDQDKPGQLGKLLRHMAQAGVNVLTQYSDHNHQLVLVVDNLQAAQAVSNTWMQQRPDAQLRPASPKNTHHYQVQIAWTGNTGSGTSSYAAYTRQYEISAPNKVTILGSSDPAFRGDKTRYNPEEFLLASASACHMLTYLHLCAVNAVVVLSYEDKPTAEMEEAASGEGAFIRVDLHPTVTITASSDTQQAEALHQEAHHLCYIANSLKTPILLHPTIKTSEHP